MNHLINLVRIKQPFRPCIGLGNLRYRTPHINVNNIGIRMLIYILSSLKQCIFGPSKDLNTHWMFSWVYIHHAQGFLISINYPMI
ncbi:hypothetical protein FC59_GL000915 [Lactobacillus kitasatonis DSM 16761 = JCM 1039]|uniref:Uncharacterized protein n=1 Tax=Lactobacillus kitasatonis DSM 16761 = JCM 1039 TaxID=1423767 RepID=A0A0R1VF07_9LACO|nr:hypothetical protein FC59_GL000915 [Lactobacillus kitasatonis DSM 16761 = JCM 1039]